MRVRNVFFNDKGITTGNGSDVLEYTGNVYKHARTMSDFFSLYDASQDIVIACDSCAKRQYSKIVKVGSQNATERTKTANKHIVRDVISNKVPVVRAKVKPIPMKSDKGCNHCNKR